ncbi:MAG: OFA family MFS transporter [Bacteroidetes bacterium]|nr:OFA family MFS transporter [Bacteroidota bacterium]
MIEHSRSPVVPNLGWRVAFAGTGINLALGVLYTWSVISQFIPKEWGWSETDKSLPYSIALLAFAFATIPAGRMQDKIGPRIVAAIGGVLVGLGMMLSSLTTSPLGYVLGFGILAGAGIGFGYASATPPAVKWFNKHKTGLIAGIVVSGFGLASVYAAPTAQWLGSSFGLQTMMLVFGVAFLIAVFGFAQLLKTPPAGYVPAGDGPSASASGAGVTAPAQREYGPGEMLRTPQFFMLWFMYACGAGAGLMVISKMAKIATDQAGLSLGFVLVAILAIGNGGGRIVAGLVSDRIGRTRTMLLCFTLQAALILLLTQTVKGSLLANAVILSIVAALIGGNYGSNLSVFPAVTKDWFGLRDFGVNYGFVFSSWGVGGLTLSLIAGAAYDATGSFNLAYFTAAGLLIIAGVMTFAVKAPRALAAAELATMVETAPVK